MVKPPTLKAPNRIETSEPSKEALNARERLAMAQHRRMFALFDEMFLKTRWQKAKGSGRKRKEVEVIDTGAD
jgi:hypothetical protein